MNALPTIKAVIFDMDGLLLDSEQIYLRSFRQTLSAFNLPENDALYMRMLGVPMTAAMTILEDGLKGVDVPTFDASWTANTKALLSEGIALKPGVTELLRHLSGTLPLGVATSTRKKTATAHLQQTGIKDRFTAIVCGDEVTCGKPAPDIYLRAAESLGVTPHHCAALEDSENGTRAAVAAGMVTVQVPDLKQPSDDLRRLGHQIAPDILSAARLLGLMP